MLNWLVNCSWFLLLYICAYKFKTSLLFLNDLLIKLFICLSYLIMFMIISNVYLDYKLLLIILNLTIILKITLPTPIRLDILPKALKISLRYQNIEIGFICQAHIFLASCQKLYN